MKKIFLLFSIIFYAMNLTAQTQIERSKIQLNEKDLVWRSGMPGTLISVLEGNPQSDSIYTIRLKLPANFIIKPHSHTSDERVTVLSGNVYVGFGDKIDKNNSTKFSVGGYYVNPPGIHHFVWTKEPAEIQITGIGPWVVNFVDSTDVEK